MRAILFRVKDLLKIEPLSAEALNFIKPIMFGIIVATWMDQDRVETKRKIILI